MWVGEHASLLFWVCIFAGLGVCGLFWPTIPVGWAMHAHPQLSKEDSFTLSIARLIGAILLFFVMVMLAILLN